VATRTPSTNGTAKKSKLPRLVPGSPSTPRPRREVDLPGIGASVVIEAPSVHAYITTQDLEGTQHDRNVALAALALVEPEMTAEQLAEAVRDWPMTDWMVLDDALADLMGITEEALQLAQREFRGADD
jgi:hypothetical protein